MRCLNCGLEIPLDQKTILCPRCGGLMEIILEPPKDISFSKLRGRGVWRYSPLIPGRYSKIVSMGEGNTPLIKSSVKKGLYMKFEGANPTGSFKDRGMTVAVSSAVSLGYKAVAAASTGNTAASAAAYSSRAGLKTYLILPKGNVALGKIAQSILYGATIMEVNGNFDLAMKSVMELYKSLGLIYPLNSFNPWRLEGQKTIAFEIAEEIGVPDYVIVPVGNGGNIYAIWKGFNELVKAGITERIPKMIGVQAEGAAPIAKSIIANKDEPEFVDSPRTIASAIKIGKPVNWKKTMKAIKESGGTALIVSDEEIIEAQKMLARSEGLGVEPASAASYAGYLKALSSGLIDENETAVTILTGHALKDPDAMLRMDTKRIVIQPEEVRDFVLKDLMT